VSISLQFMNMSYDAHTDNQPHRELTCGVCSQGIKYVTRLAKLHEAILFCVAFKTANLLQPAISQCLRVVNQGFTCIYYNL